MLINSYLFNPRAGSDHGRNDVPKLCQSSRIITVTINAIVMYYIKYYR